METCGDAEFARKVSTMISFTLDLLRRISQKSFLAYNKFPPGLSTVPSTPVHKIPRRFESMLDLKPEESVRMFVASSKVASAIYYAETALSERGWRHFSSEMSSPNDTQAIARQLETYNSLMPILRECMLTLDEPDAASAYSLRMASIHFSTSHFRLSDYVYSPCVSGENMSFLHAGKATLDKKTIAIANGLYDFGSIDALRAYADSVCRYGDISEGTKALIRETWFKAKLTAVDWTHIPDASSFDMNRGVGAQRGFFESFAEALSSLSNEDKTSFEEYLAVCRGQALTQCSLAYGSESRVASTLQSVEFFEILNDLEVVGLHRSSLPELLARWERETSTPGVTFRGTSSLFKLVVRETMISLLRAFPMPDLDIETYLTKHQWQSLSISREQGELEFAEGCLRRLRKRLSASGPSHEVSYMKIRLEEAALVESRGYPKPAIQATKLIALANRRTA